MRVAAGHPLPEPAGGSVVPSLVRQHLVPGVALLAMLGLEVVGLRSGTASYVVLGLVALLALWVIAFRLDLARAGVATACAAAFTLAWNGWRLGGLHPGDMLVMLALVLLVMAHPNGATGMPPWWVKQLLGVLVAGVLIQIFFPPSYAYLAGRNTVNAGGGRITPITSGLVGTNISVAFRFAIAVAIIPMMFVAATRVDRRALRWLALSFAAGSALSGWAATADHFGANIGHLLTRVPNVSNRQAGFSMQPNFLAASLVIAVPFAFYFAFSGVRWQRLVGFWSLGGMVLGVYASGSRGGAVCVLIALALSIVLHPRTRPHAPSIALGGLVIAGLMIAAFPALGAEILRVTRLSNSAITAGSDEVRSIVAAQGWQDFHHYWFAGIGLQASTDASQVYLQELASGGILLFFGMCVYLAGGVLTSVRLLLDRSVLAGMVLAALVTTIALDFVEADLTDRFYYLPAAILIALLDVRRRSAAGLPARSAASQELVPA